MDMRKALCVGMLLSLLLFRLATAEDAFDQQPPWQRATSWPDRIIVTLAADPRYSFFVTWRTDGTVGETKAEIAAATPDARFDSAAESIPAESETVMVAAPKVSGSDIVGNPPPPRVTYHTATFSQLEADTLYAYRVRGGEEKWSAWRQVRTAPERGSVQFLYFGDAQNGIRSHVSRVFDMAAKVAPGARFMIHGGDLVNTPLDDAEWAAWYAAGGNLLRTIPSLPVPGNHDYVNFGTETVYISERRVTPFWRPQFALPVVSELPEDLHETVYDLRYGGDLHVFAIDSTGIAFDRQMQWLAKHLETTEAKWRVVAMHHPLFAFMADKDHPALMERRKQLLAVLDSHDVDLVLTGHWHSYQRGESGKDARQNTPDAPHGIDTAYVVLASTVKMGSNKPDGWKEYDDFALSRHVDRTPMFASIRADAEALRVDAVDATGEISDAFALRKTVDGKKTITNGRQNLLPARDDNTVGPYQALEEPAKFDMPH
jgi:3',5'-cyclic AMP phosphodiesterase CpdA